MPAEDSDIEAHTYHDILTYHFLCVSPQPSLPTQKAGNKDPTGRLAAGPDALMEESELQWAVHSQLFLSPSGYHEWGGTRAWMLAYQGEQPVWRHASWWEETAVLSVPRFLMKMRNIEGQRGKMDSEIAELSKKMNELVDDTATALAKKDEEIENLRQQMRRLKDRQDDQIEELSQQMHTLLAQLSKIPQQPTMAGPITPLTRPPPAQWLSGHSTGEPTLECIADRMHAAVPTANQWPRDRPSGTVLECTLEFEAWISHLRGTLYFENETPLSMIENHLSGPAPTTDGAPAVPRWKLFQITWCRTKANRFFHICCKGCRQYVYGKYGTYDSAESARLGLEQFFKVEKSSNVAV